MRDVPLFWRGILHLIQQQMIQAAVELVQHPIGAGIFQQLGASADQVVVFQQPRGLLAAFEPVQQRSGEGTQRVRQRGGIGGGGLVVDEQDPVRLGQQRRQQPGIGPAQYRIDQRLGREGLPVRLDEAAAPGGPFGGTARWLLTEPAQHLVGFFRHGRRALRLDYVGGFAQRGLVGAVDRARDDASAVAVGVTQKPSPRGRQLGAGGARPQPTLPVVFQRFHQAGELRQRGDARKIAQRHLQAGQRGRQTARSDVRQQILARFGHRLIGVAILGELEVRRYFRFQGKPAQQRLTKGMDRADPHAARQIEHMGEQRPRPPHRRFRGVNGQLAQILAQGVRRQGYPLAQPALQADRHLGGGGFGEGQAQNSLGFCPAGHQP